MPQSKPPRPRKKQKASQARKPSTSDKPSDQSEPLPVNPILVQRTLRFKSIISKEFFHYYIDCRL